MVRTRFLLTAAFAVMLTGSQALAAKSEPQVLGGTPEQAEPAATEKESAPASPPAESAAAETPHEAAAPADAAGHGAEAAGAASHSTGHPVIPEQSWSFDGIFGTYDRAALQRGFQVYKEVCSACHSMNRLAYRNLADLGYTEGEIKAIAADVSITDGPNDEGDMFDRPGRPSDHFRAPYANIQAAKYANNGAFPPDLSLIAKARHGGANYIYAILTGYEEPPANRELLPGQYWNKAMNGNVLAMPAPLNAGQVAYGDGTDQSVDQYARDVAQFLTWASEPHMEVRKRTGVKVFLFLLVFTGVLYAAKRKVWTKVH